MIKKVENKLEKKVENKNLQEFYFTEPRVCIKAESYDQAIEQLKKLNNNK